jgi:hypothetical protein
MNSWTTAPGTLSVYRQRHRILAQGVPGKRLPRHTDVAHRQQLLRCLSGLRRGCPTGAGRTSNRALHHQLEPILVPLHLKRDAVAMSGVVRPCRRRSGTDLYRAWLAHLCGLCLTLRDVHGQLARLATNVDGLLLWILSRHRRRRPSGTVRHGRARYVTCALTVRNTTAREMLAEAGLLPWFVRSPDTRTDGNIRPRRDVAATTANGSWVVRP